MIPSPLLDKAFSKHQLLGQVDDALISGRQFALEGVLVASGCARLFAGVPQLPPLVIQGNLYPGERCACGIYINR